MATKVYHIDDHYVVSVNSVWVPGIYATEEAARLAVNNLSDQDIVAFLEHIYAYDGEDRPVTVADIETTIAAVKLAELGPIGPIEEYKGKE